MTVREIGAERTAVKETVRVRLESVNSSSVIPNCTTTTGRRRLEHLDLPGLPTRLLALERVAVDAERLARRMRGLRSDRAVICPPSGGNFTELEWLAERAEQIECELTLRITRREMPGVRSNNQPEAE
jgi:hypothetical protein